MRSQSVLVEHEIGDSVFLKSDPEQCEMIVTGFIIRPAGNLLYMLSLGTQETYHYGIEISVEKNVLKQMS